MFQRRFHRKYIQSNGLTYGHFRVAALLEIQAFSKEIKFKCINDTKAFIRNISTININISQANKIMFSKK